MALGVSRRARASEAPAAEGRQPGGVWQLIGCCRCRHRWLAAPPAADFEGAVRDAGSGCPGAGAGARTRFSGSSNARTSDFAKQTSHRPAPDAGRSDPLVPAGTLRTQAAVQGYGRLVTVRRATAMVARGAESSDSPAGFQPDAGTCGRGLPGRGDRPRSNRRCERSGGRRRRRGCGGAADRISARYSDPASKRDPKTYTHSIHDANTQPDRLCVSKPER